MLIRVTLALKEAEVRDRLLPLLKTEDVLVQVIKEESLNWGNLSLYPSDLLVISRSLIPAPAHKQVQEVSRSSSGPALVVLTKKEDVREQAALRGAGATAVLYTELETEILGEALSAIINDRRDLLTKAVAARRAVASPHLSDFVSASPAMQLFMKTVQRVVDSDSALLISGETGVGKERLSRAIHYASRRSAGPFISVNCGAVPENLIESELFGHEKGAFTGATSTKRGCFELAHNGVLFLDEIAEMPLHLQVKLLHVLQDFKIRPVGSERVIPVDVRVMAASNRDIGEEIEARKFRQDLYFRLKVVELKVPPLRERREDIPALARSFTEELAARTGIRVDHMAAEAVSALCGYDWPGNVRELINVIERAILLCGSHIITLEDLPPEIGKPVPMSSGMLFAKTGERCLAGEIPQEWLQKSLKEVRALTLAECERAYLEGLLKETGGRIGETARRAGMEPRSLFTKMRRHGLKKEDFKAAR